MPTEETQKFEVQKVVNADGSETVTMVAKSGKAEEKTDEKKSKK